jgi:flagellar hook-length control protein FliK
VEAPVADVPTGPFALVTTLDDAAGIDTPLPLPETHSDDVATDATPDQPSLNPQAPTLNGDARPVEAQPKQEPLTQAQSQDMVRQVLDKAELVKANQANAVKLQLYPEHLGKLEIKVSSHQGVISAQLTADTQQAKAALEGQVAMLQRSFAEMGLKVDKVEVTLSSANLDFNGGGQQAGAGFEFNQNQGQQNQPFQQQPARLGPGLGYEAWLPENVEVEDGYAAPLDLTAINFVA